MGCVDGESQRIGFFFGAGSSCAFGLPNVYKLTDDVEEKLEAINDEVHIVVESDLEDSKRVC